MPNMKPCPECDGWGTVTCTCPCCEHENQCDVCDGEGEIEDDDGGATEG